ncbi:hypothetical protein D3C77_618870 [compost metagenome]
MAEQVRGIAIRQRRHGRTFTRNTRGVLRGRRHLSEQAVHLIMIKQVADGYPACCQALHMVGRRRRLADGELDELILRL